MRRIADEMLSAALEAIGAVSIEGPKWCGKTRTAEEKVASKLMMEDPDFSESYLKTADVKPSLLLRGATPRLIDEWQLAPVLWDAVRFAVDQRAEYGQFILTGSAVPMDGAVRHSGTGRISRMRMGTMTLFESLESTGDVSLKALFDGNCEVEGASRLSIEMIAFVMARGGWPASIGEKESVALRHAYDYVDSVINNDISRVDGIEKNPGRVQTLMRSLARNVATTSSQAAIRNDLDGPADPISEKTMASYLNALRRIYVVEDLPAWEHFLRSRSALRTSPKRHFADPSIAVATLGATPDSLLSDFRSFGLLFESLCVRDLRLYARAIGGDLFHYRDRNGLEADAIVYLRDGRWGAVEIKLGSKEIEIAAGNLEKLRRKMNVGQMREPSFLMVLTGTELAYRRPDGVCIVPIGCLRH
jgi:predicted AAA+ superfamily ATPase